MSGQGSVERETGSQRGEEPRTHAAAARAGRAECAVHGLRSGQQRAREESGQQRVLLGCDRGCSPGSPGRTSATAADHGGAGTSTTSAPTSSPACCWYRFFLYWD